MFTWIERLPSSTVVKVLTSTTISAFCQFHENSFFYFQKMGGLTINIVKNSDTCIWLEIFLYLKNLVGRSLVAFPNFDHYIYISPYCRKKQCVIDNCLTKKLGKNFYLILKTRQIIENEDVYLSTPPPVLLHNQSFTLKLDTFFNGKITH